MIKEYQKPQPLLAYDEKLGKFLPRLISPIVDYLSPLQWLAAEEIKGLLVHVRWDGKKIEWASERENEEIPLAVELVLHDKFDNTEKVFERLFDKKEAHLFLIAYGGKINNGAYGGKERLVGWDVALEDDFLGKRLFSTVFESFDINPIELLRLENLQQAIAIVQSKDKTLSKYNLKGAETPVTGLICMPMVDIYDRGGNRVMVRVNEDDLNNVYDPNPKAEEEPQPEPVKAKQGKKTSKKAN